MARKGGLILQSFCGLRCCDHCGWRKELEELRWIGDCLFLFTFREATIKVLLNLFYLITLCQFLLVILDKLLDFLKFLFVIVLCK